MDLLPELERRSVEEHLLACGGCVIWLKTKEEQQSDLKAQRTGIMRSEVKRVVLHSPQDTKDSGYRVLCGKCDDVRLTLAEFRLQVHHPTLTWRCPICGSVVEFRG